MVLKISSTIAMSKRVVDVIIRRWMLRDIPSVRHIAFTTWSETYGSFIPQQDIQAFFDTYYTSDVLAGFCDSKHRTGFIAEVDGIGVAFAKTNFDAEKKKFYLHSLYVLPKYQGCGVGTKLFGVCEVLALSFNVNELWLGVMQQNVAALEWYKRIGFQFVEEAPFTMGKTTVQHLIGFSAIHR